MRILILGAGGIGGYFGGRLVEAGGDVTFLVRSARQKLLRRAGLVIRSPVGDAKLEVRTIAPYETDQRFDVVIVACKATTSPEPSRCCSRISTTGRCCYRC